MKCFDCKSNKNGFCKHLSCEHYGEEIDAKECSLYEKEEIMKINKEFISKNNVYSGENNPACIVIHETDNFRKGANGMAHAKAQYAGHLSTSVHFYCGDDGIYQCADLSDGVWAVGKSYSARVNVPGVHNRNSINIEICVNEDGNYMKARDYAIELVKYLRKKKNIPEGYVIRHYDAKGKYCPRNMMNNTILWEEFKEAIGDGRVTIPAEKCEIYYVNTMHSSLNVRSAPDGKIIGSLKKHSKVTVIEWDENWSRINWGGGEAYCSSKYLVKDLLSVSKNKSFTTTCNGDGVRLRTSPEFTDNIFDKLYKGNIVCVESIEGCWARVRVSGRSLYMYADYLD